MEKAMGKTPVTLVDSCPSTDSSSNVSAAPDHGDFACELPVLAHDAAKNHMKMDEEVGETSDAAEARLLLDLTLTTAGSVHNKPSSSDRVAVIKACSSLDDGAPDEVPPAGRVFTCTYCKKGFASSQALGGPQNAHRQELLITKRQQEMAAMNVYGPPSTLAYGYGGYSDVRSFSAFGPCHRLALPGVGMDQPMVYRLQPPWSQPGLWVTQYGSSPEHPHMMASPLPRVDGKPYAPKISSNNFNDAGNLGQFRAPPPPPAYNHPQQGGGAVMHSFQGPSSIVGPNVEKGRVANGWGSSGGGGGSSGSDLHVLLAKRDDQPMTDHGELELTLKL